MLLNNGKDINVLNSIQIDNHQHLVCKLKNPVYIMGDVLLKYVVLSQHEFKDFSDVVAKESAELTTIVEEPEVIPEVEENVDVLDGGEVLKTDSEPTPEV
jgi:hypothetical protein